MKTNNLRHILRTCGTTTLLHGHDYIPAMVGYAVNLKLGGRQSIIDPLDDWIDEMIAEAELYVGDS